MKKIFVALILIMLFTGCAGIQKTSDKDQLEEDIRAASRSGAKWDTYSAILNTQIEASDDVLIRDSDDSLTLSGELGRFTWKEIREALGLNHGTALYQPTTSDEFVLWKNNTGAQVDLTGMYCYLMSGTSVAWKIYECDETALDDPGDFSADTDCNLLEAALTCDGGEDSDTSITGNKDIPAGNVVGFEISASSSPGYCTFVFTVEPVD